MKDACSVIEMSKGLNPYEIIFFTHTLESPYAKLDIVKRILESTQNSGAAERRLMYGSYLSYLQIDEYLAVLETTGLIRHDRATGTFRITAKGMDFLASLRQMDYLMKTIDA